MKNLDIYEAGRAVPPEAQKSFNNGKFSGTDINPMWRIKKLTELFGPCGIGWYYDVISERAEEYNGVVIAVVDLNLYINMGEGWSKPIYGTGGNVLLNNKGNTSDEGYKMALTDALSVACKALGIGANVYFAKDKTKYTAESQNQQKMNAPPPAPKQEEPPKDADPGAMRNRLNKITFALAQGNPQNMAQAYNIWSDGKYNTLDAIPDSEILNVLHLAESIYRKRGYTD